MLPDELEAIAVQGADMGGFEQGDLFAPMGILRVGGLLLLEALADALAHFGGGRFRERDDQHLIEMHPGSVVREDVEASLHQGPRLAVGQVDVGDLSAKSVHLFFRLHFVDSSTMIHPKRKLGDRRSITRDGVKLGDRRSTTRDGVLKSF